MAHTPWHPGSRLRIREISSALRPLCLDARGRLSGQVVYVIDAKDVLGLIPIIHVGLPVPQKPGSASSRLALEPAGWIFADAIDGA